MLVERHYLFLGGRESLGNGLLIGGRWLVGVIFNRNYVIRGFCWKVPNYVTIANP